MEAIREEGAATEPARKLATPWQPWPFLLLLWGIPGALVALSLWFEGVEEGSAFLAAFAAVLGAAMLAVTAIGVIAQGVRLGIGWSKQDDRSS